MYSHNLYMQAPTGTAVGQIVEGIAASVAVPLEDYFAAVAYATEAGCRIICDRLQCLKDWEACQKRWLISIDFGRTEPEALEYLAALPRSEVRIPNGSAVLQNPNFMPQAVFHLKVHISSGRLADRESHQSLGVFVGSANLTGSGLTNGYECGMLRRWQPPLTRSEQLSARAALRRIAFLRAVWEAADRVEEILPAYRRIRLASPPPVSILDIGSAVASPVRGTSGGDILSPVLLGKARAFWVQVDELYKNRGSDRAGNQLDLPRGARAFFGFPAEDVPRNTIFGNVVIGCEGHNPVVRSMRFGNNMMDKINLPVPGKDGPKTYDHSFLLFEKSGTDWQGRRVFRLRLGKASDVKKWKRTAEGHADAEMAGGRPFGLLF